MHRTRVALLATAFYPDVLPLLEKHCLRCHREGESAPMALDTYEKARPYARAIRDAVLRGAMPPWFADSKPNEFANDSRLSAAEIEVIKRWADHPTVKGAPRAAVFGATHLTPDVTFAMPAPYSVPAKGTVDYQHFIVPTNFTTDRWIQAIEVRPSAPAVVHHAVVFVRPPRSVWLRDRAPGAAFTAKGAALEGLSAFDEVIGTYLPGNGPVTLPEDHAKLIPAGSDLIIQLHYTPTGRATSDTTRVGLVFAKQPPRYRIYSAAIARGDFEIPPRARDHTVDIAFQVQAPAAIYALAPHMHLRGRSMRVSVDDRVVLDVPRYQFNWQLVYRPARQIPLARGARIEAEAVFDNSGNPNAVRWGEQSDEEMAVCFVDFVIPAAASPNELFVAPRLLRGKQP